jgi:phosphate transport system substrate-binding protein
MMKPLKKVVSGLVLGLLGFNGAVHALEVDPKLSVYGKTIPCSGPLNSVGSDTLNNLMTLWAEAFRKFHPEVKIQIEGKGSSTAPPALIAGTSQLGPMSRKMKAEELEKFEAKFGYKPTPIGVGLDSLAVFVHRDNPIESLSLQQVDAIFSKTRKGGLQDISTWGQLGLAGEWQNRFMSLYGRNSASGTYGYFKKKALFKGDYKKTVKEQPGSASVVMGISEDLGGIGYSGIGYITSSVKALPLSKTDGAEAYEPNYENVLKGKYPLGRMLYVYVAKKPNQPLDPIVKEFFKLVLSKRGQEIVVKDGYLPLPAALAAKQLQILE